MNIRILALPLFCAASVAAFSAQAADLAEVYGRALQNDPLIREAEANRSRLNASTVNEASTVP